jgi:hypothetical protein
LKHALAERKAHTVKAMKGLHDAARRTQIWNFQPLLDALKDEVENWENSPQREGILSKLWRRYGGGSSSPWSKRTTGTSASKGEGDGHKK